MYVVWPFVVEGGACGPLLYGRSVEKCYAGFIARIIIQVRLCVSLYRGNEFAILRVFESQKSPFTTKIAGEFPP